MEAIYSNRGSNFTNVTQCCDAEAEQRYVCSLYNGHCSISVRTVEAYGMR
jgi:hypothetical protein